MNQVEIYQTKDNQTKVQVSFTEDTVWLTQKEMADLFERDRVAITQHINNIFKENELDKDSVCKDFLHTASDGKSYKTKYYNLDMIISVGYRVKSKRGIQFRQWATERLKDHLLKGYTLNEKRLHQVAQNLQYLEHTVKLIKSGNSENITITEAKGLLDIITIYTQSFILLNQFDNNSLTDEELNENITYEIKLDDAILAIDELKSILIEKKEASDLFGKTKDQSLGGILNAIVQTFDGTCLYSSIEQQAAHLLYFIIKSHPFVDGNKRIGAFLFVWFLEKNKHRFKRSGELKINDNALVALALLIAQSHPDDKDIMIRLVINLIRG